MAGPLPRHLLPLTARIDDATGRLSVGACDLLDLAAEHGTPLFVYDETHLRERCREAVAAFGPGNVSYASKAFLCKAMAALVHEEGLGIDVSTGGELHVALAAGTHPSRIVLHGNNKSVDELRMAIDAGIGRIVVDSDHELDRLEQIGASGTKVLLRVTPGVEAHTHEYVMTGQDDSKFGFGLASGAAAAAVERAQKSSAVELVGIHAHIGSNVFLLDGFTKALEKLQPLVADAGVPELSIGGGLGVAYVEGEETPTFAEWHGVLSRAAADVGITADTLHVEPGRSIAAAAAITLYTVGTIKDLPGIRTYVSVDGGMSDNPRPVLYGSGYEAFLPRATSAERPTTATIVGKHCESGDVLVRDAALPADIAVGDVLATP
ncbi:MAG TPA: diaminopimelate decarboxylase, partial [Acidimicrobiales bacterium]|nr:diaminopimelate decarboxylase [Acidimicrobiales bacterium]